MAENNLPKVFLDAALGHPAPLHGAEYAEIITAAFYASQGHWEMKGHFPRGWKGQFPAGIRRKSKEVRHPLFQDGSEPERSTRSRIFVDGHELGLAECSRQQASRMTALVHRICRRILTREGQKRVDASRRANVRLEKRREGLEPGVLAPFICLQAMTSVHPPRTLSRASDRDPYPMPGDNGANWRLIAEHSAT